MTPTLAKTLAALGYEEDDLYTSNAQIEQDYAALIKEKAALGQKLDLDFRGFCKESQLKRLLAKAENEVAALRKKEGELARELAAMNAQVAAMNAEIAAMKVKSSDLKKRIADAEKDRTPAEAAAIAESARVLAETELIKEEIQNLQAEKARNVWLCRLLYGVAVSRSLLPPLRGNLATNDPAFSKHLTKVLDALEKAPAPPPSPRRVEVEWNPPLNRFLPQTQTNEPHCP